MFNVVLVFVVCFFNLSLSSLITLVVKRKFTRTFIVSVRRRSSSLRERLRTHKVFTKDQYIYLNYHEISIKSYVVDVY